MLERGYAVPLDEHGRVLKTPRGVRRPAAPFRLRVADGEVPARVEPACRMSVIADELARLEEIVRRLEADDSSSTPRSRSSRKASPGFARPGNASPPRSCKVQKVLEEAGGDLRITDLDA